MLRFGFVTCVQLGLSCMEAIYEAGGSLSFAATLHDELAAGKSGRVYLDSFCRVRDIPLFKLRNVNDADAIDAIRRADLDWLFIIGWSQIARRPVLEATRRGLLGMHPTLLPTGRGRAAIPWAILLGLQETGVTLFKLDEGIDSGPIAAQLKLPLSPRETSTELYRRVNDAHRELVRASWPALASGTLHLTPQDHSAATYWAGRTPEEGRLNPSMSVEEADRLIRAVTRPYPGAFIDRDGQRLRVWAARLVTEGDASGLNRELRIAFANGALEATDWEWSRVA
jgi:methionyl-tRNA formyltransferase